MALLLGFRRIQLVLRSLEPPLRHAVFCVCGGVGVTLSLAAAQAAGVSSLVRVWVCGGGLRTQECVLYYFDHDFLIVIVV
ncbi:hypothetical protein, partial [Bifidobacterium dolichotidis]|uniref:hypothetical protein n=1 Tax=Bifidobacterium dolichotidis TaxID=2306976 RepID=UPI0019CF907B